MAELRIERKRSSAWLIWLLAGVVLLLLLLWALVWNAPDREADRSQTAAELNEPVTDFILIVRAPDKPALVGRRVQITEARVDSVVGDRTFWIGTPGERLFVALDEVGPDGQPNDQRVNINAGQTVSVTGTIKTVPAREEAQRLWTLDEEGHKQVQGQQVYLSASRADVKQ